LLLKLSWEELIVPTRIQVNGEMEPFKQDLEINSKPEEQQLNDALTLVVLCQMLKKVALIYSESSESISLKERTGELQKRSFLQFLELIHLDLPIRKTLDIKEHGVALEVKPSLIMITIDKCSQEVGVLKRFHKLMVNQIKTTGKLSTMELHHQTKSCSMSTCAWLMITIQSIQLACLPMVSTTESANQSRTKENLSWPKHLTAAAHGPIRELY